MNLTLVKTGLFEEEEEQQERVLHTWTTYLCPELTPATSFLRLSALFLCVCHKFALWTSVKAFGWGFRKHCPVYDINPQKGWKFHLSALNQPSLHFDTWRSGGATPRSPSWTDMGSNTCRGPRKRKQWHAAACVRDGALLGAASRTRPFSLRPKPHQDVKSSLSPSEVTGGPVVRIRQGGGPLCRWPH